MVRTAATPQKKAAPAKTAGRRAYSYRGQTFWNLWEIPVSLKLYYNLYRKSTDINIAVSKLWRTIGKSGYVFNNEKGETIENPLVADAFKYIQIHKETIIRDLWIWGNAYLIPVKNWFNEVIDFQVIDPRTMYVIADKFWDVRAYIQKSTKWEVVKFDPSEVYHLIDSRDHDNEVIGKSRIETLIYDIMWDAEAGKSNYAFFKNNAIPNTLIILDENLKETEIDNAIEQLKEQFAGGENKHKISANIGIKDVKQLSQSMRDMEFLALRRFTTDKVCAQMEVPRMLLWYTDNVNFSTSDNAYRTFIEDTVRPLEMILERFFSEIIENEFWTKILFEFIDNRQFDRKDQIDEIDKRLANGTMTLNEARKLLWDKPYEGVEMADKPIIKNWYILVEDIWSVPLSEQNSPTK